MSLTSSFFPQQTRGEEGGGKKTEVFDLDHEKGRGQKSTKPEDRQQKNAQKKKEMLLLSPCSSICLFRVRTDGVYVNIGGILRNITIRAPFLLQFFRAKNFELPLRHMPTIVSFLIGLQCYSFSHHRGSVLIKWSCFENNINS